MHKLALIAHLNALLATKAHDLRTEIAATLEARNSDTKSSAGDKHEVGRAMVQQELDQLEGRLVGIRSMQQELARVPMDRVHEQVGFGSLVATDQGTYYISIGLGAVEVDGERCYAISLASPIGQALKGKTEGEVIDINGKRIELLGVE